MLAHRVAGIRHPFVLGPAPPLTFRGPPCRHLQPPSIGGSAPPGPQHRLPGAGAGAVGGGSRLCHPQEMGTRRPRGTGARREGADQHQSKRLPPNICPCCQVPPRWSVPGGVTQLSRPCGCSPQPQAPPHHQPGPRCPWGIPAAPGAPWTPTQGLEHPWPAEVWLLPPLPSACPELVEHPPAPCHPPTLFRLPGSIRLSVCPAGLSSPMGSPALPGASRDGDPGRGTLISKLWGSCGIQLGHSPSGREGMGDTPACQSRPARRLLPGCLLRAGSGHLECPAEMPRLGAPPSPCPTPWDQVPPWPAPHHGSGNTQHWRSGSQVPFSLPKLTANMPGLGTLQSTLQVGAASERHSWGALSPWGTGRGGQSSGAMMGSKHGWKGRQ